MLLLTAAGAFRKPDENGPSSSSESGFAEYVQSPVPHFAVLFKSSTRKLRKNRFVRQAQNDDVLQNQSSASTAKQVLGIEQGLSSFWISAGSR